MKKTILYILIILGTLVTLMPFMWMVVTSFKTSSEVQQWPPRWTSKNFSGKRNVKISVANAQTGGTAGLSIREAMSMVTFKNDEKLLDFFINDDKFYRGTLTLKLKGFEYTDKMNNDDFNSFVSGLEFPVDISYNSAEEFFSNVFYYYKTGTTPYFDRSAFINKMSGVIEQASKTTNTLKTF